MNPDHRMNREEYARRQAALVAALVASAPAPSGFDESRLRAAARALMRKRADEVGEVWRGLRSSLGPRWTASFAEWAKSRPPHGALRDGWDFARTLSASGMLGALAAAELAEREVHWRYDGASPPRRRRLGIAATRGGLLVQVRGRLWRSDQRR